MDWLTHVHYAARYGGEWRPLESLNPVPPPAWGWWDLVRGPHVGVLVANGLTTWGAGHLFGAGDFYLPDHSFWYYNPPASEVWTASCDLSPTREIDGVVLDLTTLYSTNIYHFIYDCLPRLFLLQAASLADITYDAVLLASPDNQLAESIASLIPLPDAPIVRLGATDVARAARSIAPSYPSWAGGPAPWAVQFLRRYVSMRFPRRQHRLFVTRRGRDRDVANLDEVLDLLKRHGFYEYEAGRESDDLQMFAGAEAIVAPHGAGLAPLFMCDPKCVLIELFSEAHLSPMYALIAAAIGMRYHHLIGPVANQPSVRVKALDASLEIPDDNARREIQEHIRQSFTISVAELQTALDTYGL